MYVGKDFQVSNPSESEVYGFDFTNDLLTGETISTVAFFLTVAQASAPPTWNGTDATPSSHLSGSASFLGNITSQRITTLNGGVLYLLRCVVTTSLGNTLELNSHIPASTPG